MNENFPSKNAQLSLGLDIGSVNLHAVLLEAGGGMRLSFSIPVKGSPRGAFEEAVKRLAPAVKGERFTAGVTGAGRDLIGGETGACSVNDIVALALGAGRLAPAARSVAEVGGHLSKWLVLDGKGGILDYALNELCAAGSGAFFEQQAGRLELPAARLAELASKAASGAPVAGRCSVFAKSDMIHLQQKGTPLDEIAYGLCLAMARNFAATLLKGREPVSPVALAGGCAANQGFARAFSEVLGLGKGELIIPDDYLLLGAAGAAAAAARDNAPLINLDKLAAGRRERRGKPAGPALKPLSRPSRPGGRLEETLAGAPAGAEVFLGLDVGSVSTDFVLLDAGGKVLEGVYLPTRGRPIEAISEGLAILGQRTGGKARVLASAATGSGRQLAARFIGADAARNEITAQLKSTVLYFPEADTIFEIGGQDSKYISLKEGRLCDFAMNKICAAGTGSFLEEQASRLGLDIIGEFEERALRGKSPADFGSQCTVFMDTELVHSIQRGASVEDISAGLAYSIARNYLEKVVGGRAVGKNIIFQGGVASNAAVVAAFSSLLGREVRVHPHNRISGAIGAALIAREMYARAPFKSAFAGFGAAAGYRLTGFECRRCPNRCQVNKIERDGGAAYFGDVCERYAVTAGGAGVSAPRADLFGEREKLLAASAETAESAPAPGGRAERVRKLIARYVPAGETPGGRPAGPGPLIGIPRTSLYFELYPLWAAMFKSLGCRVLLSEPSSRELLDRGIRKLSTEACLPVKLGVSHVADLAGGKTDFIFLPSILDLPSAFGRPELCSTCPYTQTLPYVAGCAVKGKFLAPQVNLSVETDGVPEGLEAVAGPLGAGRDSLRAAFQAGKEAYLRFKENIARRGKEVRAWDFEWAAVLIGKPYNLYDPFLNMNLAAHLARMGIPAVPYEFLLGGAARRLDASWDSLPWRFNRDYVKAAMEIAADKRLYPVVVSNFGCGPDGFTLKHLEKILAGRPALFLEFDEHRGEAGLVTRLEAFADEVAAHRENRAAKPGPAKKRGPQRGAGGKKKFFIPNFADHAHAFAGALRYAGYEARVLPLPDTAVQRAGERFSSGKECHPYSILAGDLVRLAESLPAGGGSSVFFYPGTMIPCLLAQYGPAHRLILDTLGQEKLEVMTPSSRGLYELLGLQGGVRLWRGITAIDALIEMLCGMRPYETDKGSLDLIHRVNLLDITRAIEGGDIIRAAEECMERLAAVPMDTKAWERREKPVVGIAGDLYTRANSFANRDLFHRLEEGGCEVWPSPFIVDIFDFGLKNQVARSLERRDFQKFFSSGSLLLLKELSEQGFNNKIFRERARHAEEPGFRQMVASAAPYVGGRSLEVLMVNIAKMAGFAANGADGIVNAMCLNCMVGTVSAAVTAGFRSDHGNIPVVNLVFGGTEGTSQSLRLEAFIHQVKIYKGRCLKF